VASIYPCHMSIIYGYIILLRLYIVNVHIYILNETYIFYVQYKLPYLHLLQNAYILSATELLMFTFLQHLYILCVT
jgi:hypothetical protein